MDKQEKEEPVTPCMDKYKSNIQSDGSLDRLNLRLLVRGDLQNKDLFGDNWSPTTSTRNLKYFLAYSVNHKAIVNQLDFIGSLLQEKVQHRISLQSASKYADYFQNIQMILEEP